MWTQVTSLRDFFREDNVFIAYGQEKHSACDFTLNNEGTVAYSFNM